MDLNEIVAELVKQDTTAVVTALQSKAQPLFQQIFDKGHAEATRRLNEQKTELEGKLSTLQTELTTAKGQIVTLSAGAPDIKKFQDEITRLEGEVAKTKTDSATLLISERLDRQFQTLETRLVAKGVDPEYASVLLSKTDIRKRLQASKDGGIEVLREGGIPYSPAEGKTGLDLFADELMGKVPAKFVSSTVDRGSGVRTGGAGGGTTEDGDYFKTLRADLDKKREAEAKTTAAGPTEAARRLGMTSPSV
jgi:hypothetical protein